MNRLKDLFMIYLMASLVFAGAYIAFVPDSADAVAPSNWFDSDWLYCKEVTISNKIDDYQTRLNVTYSSGGDVDCEGHCQADFGDLRFARSDGAEIPYYIENYTASDMSIVTVNNSYNDSTIFMYYGYDGGGSAVTNGNPYTTFDFYHNGSDYADWAVTGSTLTVSQVGDMVEIKETTTDVSNSATLVVNPCGSVFAVEFKIRVTNMDAGYSSLFCRMRDDSATLLFGGFWQLYSNQDCHYWRDASSNSVLYDSYSHTLNYTRREVVNDTDNKVMYQFLDYSSSPYSMLSNVGWQPFAGSGGDFTNIYIHDGTGYACNFQTFISWVRISKYSDTAPSFSFGAEQEQIGDNQPPSVPSNPVPVNGSTSVAFPSVLDWDDCTDSENDDITYICYIGNDTNPADEKLLLNNGSSSQASTGTFPFLVNHTYYWLVIAWDDNATAMYSQALFHFTTVNPNWDGCGAENSRTSVFFVDAVNNQVGIGTSAPYYTLQVEGSIGYRDGLYHYSDARIKEVVNTELPKSLVVQVCSNVNISRYYLYDFYLGADGKYKKGDLTDNQDIGFIAQQVYGVLVDAGLSERLIAMIITKGDNSQLWSVNQVAMTTLFARYAQILADDLMLLELRVAHIEDYLETHSGFHPIG